MYKYTQPIRDFINQARRQHILAKDKTRWNQLCSALDALEDVELAIEAYLDGRTGETEGSLYLAAYGVLQALNLQHDATRHLCESLGIPDNLDKYPRLRDIKQIRHESAGHPTKRDRGPRAPSYHFISRPSLTKEGFDLLCQYADSDIVEVKKVSIPQIVEEQRRFIIEALELILSKLREEETAHKAKFAMTKLVSAFPDSLSYDVEKLFEHGSEYAGLGKICVQQIDAAVAKFKDLLAERRIELDTYGSLRYHHDELSYVLSKLAEFFRDVQAGHEPKIEARTAHVFAWYVRHQLSELQKIAQELDDYYAS